MTAPTIAPHNLEVEVSVLGAIIQDREALCTARGILRQADFYADSHRIVYGACLDLFERNEPVDLITLGHELIRRKQLEVVIGPDGTVGSAALAAFVDAVPTAANIGHHARIVRDLAARSHLASVCIKTAERINGNGLNPGNVTGELREAIAQMDELARQTADRAAKPVNGETLLTDLVTAVERFIILPPHAAKAIALWVVAAHALTAFDLFPMLMLLSPVKRCGKTTHLAVLSRLLPKPIAASNISAAAVYRTIQDETPSLLIDEADTFAPENEPLRGVLNSGHSKDLAFVVRMVGEGTKQQPVRFATWCPKVLAAIGRLPETWQDRSIIIPMRRRAKGERVERARRPALESLRALGQRAAVWAFQNHKKFTERVPIVPAELDDRAADNWEPLFAIADLVGGPWPEWARKAALALSAGRDAADDDVGIRLLRNIQVVFSQRQVDRIASVELVATLLSDEEWGWATWRKGRPLDQRSLSRLLAPFGVKPKNIRVGDQVPKGYARDSFDDAWSRYLVSEPLQPPQSSTDAELGPLFDPLHRSSVADAKSHLTGDKHSYVAGVADEKPIQGHGPESDEPPHTNEDPQDYTPGDPDGAPETRIEIQPLPLTDGDQPPTNNYHGDLEATARTDESLMEFEEPVDNPKKKEVPWE